MTQKKSTERRAQIIQGAFDAMQSQGLPTMSYDAIAESAGLTRQLVRYHFPDPEGLMLAVCNMLAELYREAMVSTAGQQTGPTRVDAFLDFYFDLLEGRTKPRDDKVYDALLAMANSSRPIRNNLASQYKLLGQVLAQEFLVQYPKLDQRSSAELSYLFVCLMYGHWKMVATLGFDNDHRYITRRAMDRLIRSYVEYPGDSDAEIRAWTRDPPHG